MFASVRPYHQPISRKDIMPTPSQPMKSWNKLLAVTRISMVMRNRRRYLKNKLMFGSDCIYHVENSIMDQVTSSATGINSVEKWSSFRLVVSFRVWIDIQCQLEMTISCPEKVNSVAGIRLIKKA